MPRVLDLNGTKVVWVSRVIKRYGLQGCQKCFGFVGSLLGKARFSMEKAKQGLYLLGDRSYA